MSVPEAAVAGELGGPWSGLRRVMPEVLRVEVGAGFELWQLIGVVLLSLLLWVVAILLVALVSRAARGLSRRTESSLDDALIAQLTGPARLLSVALLMKPAVGVLAFPASAVATLEVWERAFIVLALFWALLRSVTIVAAHIGGSEWARSRPGANSLVMLGGSIARVAVLAVGVITVLSELNYPVASIIAGLGLGGLALALAAQKTVEHMFGAFSLAVDQPFRVGDFVKVEDFVGTVETIGLRSTRFRTLDRTLISIPNGKLADARLETFAARDRIRLACTLGLVYQTTANEMRQVLDGVEKTLRAHPKIWPDTVVVKFKEFGPSSLDVEVMAWFQTSDWGEFQQIRQEVLLEFMEVVERAGSSFAFPTHTIHLVRDGEAKKADGGAPASAR